MEMEKYLRRMERLRAKMVKAVGPRKILYKALLNKLYGKWSL